MKHKHLLALLQSDYTTIEVTFDQNGKRYTYKTRLSEGIQEGDAVVVDSPSQGLVVVQVVAVHKVPKIDIDAPFTYKWIVQRVDRSSYDRTLEQEAKFADMMFEVERVRQRELLLQQFKENLPEGSAARSLFDSATSLLVEGDAHE